MNPIWNEPLAFTAEGSWLQVFLNTSGSPKQTKQTIGFVASPGEILFDILNQFHFLAITESPAHNEPEPTLK